MEFWTALMLTLVVGGFFDGPREPLRMAGGCPACGRFPGATRRCPRCGKVS